MWKWLKRFFTKKPVVIDVPISFKPVWGFIAPHTLKSGGAYSKKHKLNEYKYALKMYSFMEFLLPIETRDAAGVKGAAKALKERGATATIENHKNAYNTKAEGFEVLYLKGDELSKKYALMLVAEVKIAFPNLKIRHGNGLLAVKRKGRGGANLVAGKKYHAVSLLTEFFFIDSPNIL